MLYDEPTTGLDPILSTTIENLMNQLNTTQHVSSIVVSHQPSTIMRTSRNIYLIKDKTISVSDQTERVLSLDESPIKHFIEGVGQ